MATESALLGEWKIARQAWGFIEKKPKESAESRPSEDRIADAFRGLSLTLLARTLTTAGPLDFAEEVVQQLPGPQQVFLRPVLVCRRGAESSPESFEKLLGKAETAHEKGALRLGRGLGFDPAHWELSLED